MTVFFIFLQQASTQFSNVLLYVGPPGFNEPHVWKLCKNQCKKCRGTKKFDKYQLIEATWHVSVMCMGAGGGGLVHIVHPCQWTFAPHSASASASAYCTPLSMDFYTALLQVL